MRIPLYFFNIARYLDCILINQTVENINYYLVWNYHLVSKLFLTFTFSGRSAYDIFIAIYNFSQMRDFYTKYNKLQWLMQLISPLHRALFVRTGEFSCVQICNVRINIDTMKYDSRYLTRMLSKNRRVVRRSISDTDRFIMLINSF